MMMMMMMISYMFHQIRSVKYFLQLMNLATWYIWNEIKAAVRASKFVAIIDVQDEHQGTSCSLHPWRYPWHMQEHIQQGRHPQLFPLESLESQGLAHAGGQHFVRHRSLLSWQVLSGWGSGCLHPVRFSNLLRQQWNFACLHLLTSLPTTPIYPWAWCNHWMLDPDVWGSSASSTLMECHIYQWICCHIDFPWLRGVLFRRSLQHHAWNARMWTSYLPWDPDILILSKLDSVGRGFSQTSTSYFSESMSRGQNCWAADKPG